jgi:non-haem Fe2+, alpha-ketoglutarate-dependent halogenase
MNMTEPPRFKMIPDQRKLNAIRLRYCAAGVSARLGWSARGVVVSGVDVDRHWANPARPVDEPV